MTVLRQDGEGQWSISGPGCRRMVPVVDRDPGTTESQYETNHRTIQYPFVHSFEIMTTTITNHNDNHSTLPKLTITYFEFGGRADPTRLTCVIGGIPFSNVVVPQAEFAERKREFPLQQLPLLVVVDQNKGETPTTTTIGQSDAMLRYVGTLTGLYPSTDPVMAMKVDHWLDVIGEWTKYVMLTYGGAKTNLISETEWTEEELMAVGQRAIDIALPKYLGAMEQEIEANGGTFILGDTLTIADMKLMHWIPWIQSGGLPAFPPSCLEPYPNVVNVVSTISDMPQVKAYHEEHPLPYGAFDFIPPRDNNWKVALKAKSMRELV